jgi:hypothetical protein
MGLLHGLLDILKQCAPALTPLVAFVVGVVGFGLTLKQLKLNRLNQRETTAKATYREFLKLAVEHPDLAEGDYQAIKQKGLQAKYDWFVAYFLWAAEEILNYDPKEWQKNLEAVAIKHCEYFRTSEFQNEELPLYTDTARALVGSALAKRPGSTAATK